MTKTNRKAEAGAHAGECRKSSTMKKLKMLILTAAIALLAVITPAVRTQAANVSLPDKTPIWFDAEFYATAYPDVAAVYGGANAATYGGFDSAMWFHYKNYGVKENRVPAASPNWFDAAYYAATYPDVAAVFGTNADSLFQHYILLGRSELRRPNASYVHTMAKDGTITGNVTPAQSVTPVAPTPSQATTPVAPQTTSDVAYIPTGIPCNGSPYYIVVDRELNVCTVLTVGADGTYSQLVKSMLCSTGRAGHGTPSGTFSIYEHTAGGGWVYMADGTWAVWGMRFRTGGYMFHSVCFTHKGDLLPIPEEVAALGSKASLGCVRLSVEDAMWLYNLVPDGTLVTIA